MGMILGLLLLFGLSVGLIVVARRNINAPNNSGTIVGGDVGGSVHQINNAQPQPPTEPSPRRGGWIWVERLGWIAGILGLMVAALPLLGELAIKQGWRP